MLMALVVAPPGPTTHDLDSNGLDLSGSKPRKPPVGAQFVRSKVRVPRAASMSRERLERGRPTCDHYAGVPCRDGRDGLERLYVIWTAGTKPVCSQMRCIED
jgi:hypothetical protein